MSSSLTPYKRRRWKKSSELLKYSILYGEEMLSVFKKTPNTKVILRYSVAACCHQSAIAVTRRTAGRYAQIETIWRWCGANQKNGPIIFCISMVMTIVAIGFCSRSNSKKMSLPFRRPLPMLEILLLLLLAVALRVLETGRHTARGSSV